MADLPDDMTVEEAAAVGVLCMRFQMVIRAVWDGQPAPRCIQALLAAVQLLMPELSRPDAVGRMLCIASETFLAAAEKYPVPRRRDEPEVRRDV